MVQEFRDSTGHGAIDTDQRTVYLLWDVTYVLEKGEGEGEKHPSWLSQAPSWELNPGLSGLQAHAQSTEPHQPGRRQFRCQALGTFKAENR